MRYSRFYARLTKVQTVHVVWAQQLHTFDDGFFTTEFKWYSSLDLEFIAFLMINAVCILVLLGPDQEKLFETFMLEIKCTSVRCSKIELSYNGDVRFSLKYFKAFDG